MEDHRFIGVNPPALDETGGSIIGYAAQASFKAGFQSDLHFNGGDIDAEIDYDLDVNTTLNKTTDTLQIHTSVTPTGGSFTTVGPSGDYNLDFIFQYQIHFAITYDVGIDSGDIYGINIGDNLAEPALRWRIQPPRTFPPPTFRHHRVGAMAEHQRERRPLAAADGRVSGNDASNNFLRLDVERRPVLSDVFLGGSGPVRHPLRRRHAGLFELVDLDISGGLSLLQNFVQPTIMTGVLLQDGSRRVHLRHGHRNPPSDIDLNGNPAATSTTSCLDQWHCFNQTDVFSMQLRLRPPEAHGCQRHSGRHRHQAAAAPGRIAAVSR